MTLPDRPVSGASIESVWGQAVHDYTFTPLGCRLHGTSRSVGASATDLNLSVADDDPAGFLQAGNIAEVPTDGGGLYFIIVRWNSVNGSAGSGFQTRGIVNLNGSLLVTDEQDNAGGTNVSLNVVTLKELSAGDQLSSQALRKGAGTDPTVSISYFYLLRIGAEFGGL